MQYEFANPVTQKDCGNQMPIASETLYIVSVQTVGATFIRGWQGLAVPPSRSGHNSTMIPNTGTPIIVYHS